jgi:tRNA G10  N-methylase Trm11
MKYFFILGNHPDLSVAEIRAVLGDGVSYLFYGVGALIVEGEELDLSVLNRRLGGTVKMGEIIELVPDLADRNIKESIKKLLLKATKPFFGISLYGARHDFLKLALTLKKEIKIAERSPRYVTSREKVLSSVVVEQNKLTSGGTEIVLIKTYNGYWLGRTVVVQPFKELSARDYGRPARDDASGMLPPKLAQIMINLAGADLDQTILDPFCGSGTMLSEAALMGYGKLIGTDVSEKAITDSQHNFQFLISNFQTISKSQFPKAEFLICNVLRLSEQIKVNSVDAIITEPYLGPQKPGADVRKVKRELDELYSKALGQFAKVLKAKGSVVMIWPRMTDGRTIIDIEPEIEGFKMVNSWPEELKNMAPKELVYGREGQRVWRRIVILVKK